MLREREIDLLKGHKLLKGAEIRNERFDCHVSEFGIISQNIPRKN